LDSGGIRRVRFCRIETGNGRIPGTYDGIKCLTLVFHVAFDGFNEIRNQVMTPRQLHINLGKGIFDPVARIHQAVVDTDHEQHQRNDYGQEYQK